jgi:microcystin-dependent protein
MGMGIGGGAAGAGDYPMRSNGAYDPNFRTQFEANDTPYGSFQGGHQHSVSGTTSVQSVATNQNAGGLGGVTQAHNNLQPYVVVNYIIKL